MTPVAVQLLIAAGVHPTQARAFADPLQAACALFAIDSPQRVAAFLGQVIVESDGLQATEENLYYSSAMRLRAVWPSRFPTAEIAQPYTRNPQKLANHVYAGRLGNGDEASGDGWRYRGRGLIQVTGRNNYAAAAAGCSRPYLDQPELVAQPSDAALSAAHWWHANGCNALADAWDLSAITRRVNGPAMLAEDRRSHIAEAVAEVLSQPAGA